MDFPAVERKWQKAWDEAKAFQVKADKKKEKYYVLEMYPYPSGSGLHMGHARNYTLGDSYARFKRMQGYNVLYPMGYDSFGLPAENAAIQAKSHPRIYTEASIKNFISQQKALGLSYDWSRQIASHTPEYYTWDQWIFLQLYKKGLAYKKTSIVNWCKECATVLANEQVVDGCCWRHDNIPVENKELNQWFIKITEYAEQLLKGLEKLDWPEDIKQMQRNWIGKSHGTLLTFDVVNQAGERIDTISIFTTRPDTVHGITYLVLACEHPKVSAWTKGTEHEKKVAQFIKETQKHSLIERTAEGKEKNGMFLGVYFINPFTKEKLPLWVADYCLYDYGTGAVMAVPAHDQRDYSFAKKYHLPIKVVISPDAYDLKEEKMARAFIEDGTLVNSGTFDGMRNTDAMEAITVHAEKNKWGKKTTTYKLRDWLISRQRYWGCPIPIAYCDTCGIVPVPEKELPVLLPEDVTFGKGNPLATSKTFAHTPCPACGKEARRETDTMDTFIDSSWYFLRYCDPTNEKLPFTKDAANYWLPIDQYIGGKEHATGHLIYFRFLTKFLKDLGLHSIDEPAQRLYNQGMLHKGGVVMSKSKGNVVLPEEVSKTHGIDTARLFLLFVAGPDKDMEWSDQGIEGASRFMKRFITLLTETTLVSTIEPKVESKLHRTIQEVTEHFESFNHNKALIAIMKYVNYLSGRQELSRKSAETLLLLLAPIIPHICEELWEGLGKKPFISLAEWPGFDKKKIKPELEAEDDFIEKVREDILSLQKLIKFEPKELQIILSPKWKYGALKKLKKTLNETRDMKTLITATMTKGHEKEIAPLVSAILKDPSKMPEFILTQEKEKLALESAKDTLSKELKLRIKIDSAEKSTEQKAGGAIPGKPALVFS
ncbi:MAG: leucine--tRNA ligase [Nanoarchaeota archaeon]